MMADDKFSDAFTFLPQGGIIQEFRVAGHNIVLGFPSAESYKSESNQFFFGETIGRLANRVAGARIDSLNGKSYELTANNGANTLHGGARGWGKREFDGPKPVHRGGRESVMFTYLSRDGEEGFPGTVELKMWYTPSVDRDGDVSKTSLEIEYEVRLVGDEVAETVVGVTNHSYFNISGGPTIEGTQATLPSNLHLPTDGDGIPTGAIEPYPEFEANKTFTFGAETPDPDHCFVVHEDPSGVPLDTRARPLKLLVSLYHPNTKLHLEALSTEPAFQFYAGRFVNMPAMDGMPARGPRSGLCIEASRFVHAVNTEQWRHMVVLAKGQVWGSKTVYRAWQD